MKTMIFYELKKIFGTRKSVMCGLLVLLLCGGVFAMDCFDKQTLAHLDDIRKSTAVYTGEITPERMAPLIQRYSEITGNQDNWIETENESVLNAASAEEIATWEYALSRNAVNAYRNERIAYLQTEALGLREADLNRLLMEKEQAMLSKNPNISIGYNLFFDYFVRFIGNVAPIMLGFLIILFLAPLFSMEYSTRMDGLILSSKRGKRSFIVSKLLAALLTISVIHVAVIGFYTLLCGVFWGLDGAATSLTATFYNPFPYIFSPFGFSMGQYFFYAIGVSYAACIGLGSLTLFLSSKTRNAVLCMSIVMVIFFVPLLIYALGGYGDIVGGINFSYGRIMQVYPLVGSFRGHVLFGEVILEKSLVLAALGITTVAFLWGAFQTFKKHQVVN
ncbi:hypothetical protein LJC74_07125 [Eubacteriales bacterium OttesenSCG-928-A19]|nr:hypothetical protein [Eubacteriales bacterium OttesenSCG-928-A19]